MIDSKHIFTIEDTLRYIEKKYPKATTKVTPSFAREVLMRIEPLVMRSAHVDPRAVDRLGEIYNKVKAGTTAVDFHTDVRRVLSRLEAEHSSSTPDSSISRLERQLSDLRSMVTTPSDVDRKFRDLQAQLEAIREDAEDKRAVVSDKQEDMLQKFLASAKKAFIIMPFQRDFDNVWLGAIKPACNESHYAPLRVDEVNLSSLITEDIETYSNMADVVIVDLTGNNPNVMFELGWALAKNKKPIVICQGEHSSKVSFDVRGIRHITYENSWLGVEALKKKIKEYIATTEKQPSSAKPKKARLVKGKTPEKSE